MKNAKKTRVVLFTLAMIFTSNLAYAADLKSKWDNIVSTQQSSTAACTPLSTSTTSLAVRKYKADDGSVKHQQKKAYEFKTQDIRLNAEKIVNIADAYVAKGNSGDANCAAQQLLHLAQERELLGGLQGNQAHVFAAWMLNAYAVSWLKVRGESGLTVEEQKEIEDWMSALALSTINFQKHYRVSAGPQNLKYWAALAVMNTGIATDNQHFFNYGLQWGIKGINSIRKDGTLPLEMKRKSKALSYHFFALNPLIQIAELAEENGENLYSINNNGIARALATALNGLKDPSFFVEKTGYKQKLANDNKTPMAWLKPYAERFTDPNYMSLIKEYNQKPMLYNGGAL